MTLKNWHTTAAAIVVCVGALSLALFTRPPTFVHPTFPGRWLAEDWLNQRSPGFRLPGALYQTKQPKKSDEKYWTVDFRKPDTWEHKDSIPEWGIPVVYQPIEGDIATPLYSMPQDLGQFSLASSGESVPYNYAPVGAYVDAPYTKVLITPTPVPEPDTWLLMLLGFILVGSKRRISCQTV